jgi:hypothetical protein
MKLSRLKRSFFLLLGLMFVGMFIFYLGCDGGGGGGGGGDDSGESDTSISVPLNAFVDTISLDGSQPTQFKFTYNLPVGARPYTGFTVDFADTLQAVSVDVSASGAGLREGGYQTIVQPYQETSAMMTVRVASAAQEETVCQVGELYGPYTIYGSTAYEPESVDPQTAQATQATLSIVNTGAFSICIEITSPVDATLSVSAIDIDVEPCETPPADIAGVWTGTYSCENIGCSDEGGDILLTITRDGYSAHYESEGGAVYDGTVCGNTFRFNGGADSYTEEGVFTLNADGSGSKTSSWVGKDGICSGQCTDALQRQ